MSNKSIWGKEDPDTVKLLESISLKGHWLNLAAGDGRYTNLLLSKVDRLVASDIEEQTLQKLQENCPQDLKNKLEIKAFDITNRFPFNDSNFDGVLCTGTLHLFRENILKPIVSEIQRVLKPQGKVIIDFATNIRRQLPDGSLHKKQEGKYTLKETNTLLQKLFKSFDIEIHKSKVPPEEIDEGDIKYTFSCDFFILVGKKKPNIVVVDEDDKVIDHKAREVVDKEGLRYRVSALWIKNSKGESLLARRAYTKNHDPGKWGPAVAGTVDEGESYEENIIKEAEEELGIKNISVEKGPKIKSDEKHKHFTQWFTCEIDNPAEDLQIQEEEVEEVKWFSKDEFEKQIKNNPDEFLKTMRKYSELF